jgi:hypothetical protein
VDPCPERPLTGAHLNPAEADIQLDVEKVDINSPDPTPAVAASEGPSGVEDVEMGEPAVLNAQDKGVSRSTVRNRKEAELSNAAT